MIFYNISIYIYLFLAGIVARFNSKARLWTDGRKNIFALLEEAIKPNDKIIWVHCASLGEFEQGRPVIEALRESMTEHKILLTFFSPSGYEIRKNYQGADYIFYLPADTARNAKRFISLVHPEIAVFIKYEFWLNYLSELRKSGCKTFIVSAIFRRNSVFFKWYGGLFRKALRTFEHIFVQNSASQEMLGELGLENVTVAGDTRFDRVATIAAAAKHIEIVERFTNNAPTFVAGSTWEPDEQLIVGLIAAHPELKFIIAPHEMEQQRIDRFIEQSPRKAVRYTQCTPQTDLEHTEVLIIDTIGILSSIYQYASYAYIGGGFGVGIHNTLEAATFGLPIAFGPNYHKFKEACEMIKIGASHSVSTLSELELWLNELEQDPDKHAHTRALSSNYIKENKGATNIFIAALK